MTLPPPRPPRKQARVNRQNLKKVAQDEKKVRLVARVEDGRREVRMAADPTGILRERMTWCTTRSDTEGDWSWGQQRQWSDGDFYGHIKMTLDALSSNTWVEIMQMASDGHRMHHEQSVESIVDEAQGRWEHLEIDEDEAFRFRLTGRQRAWGFREGSHFRMVWYDPLHKIYPVEKK